MGEVPTTVNKPIATVNQILNGSIMKVGAPIVTNLISSVPALSFLKIWPLSAILSWVVGFVLQYFSVFLQQCGIKMILHFQTAGELSDYEKTEGPLHEALNKGDLLEIKKTSDEFDKAAASLIHWDGSSPIIR